MPIFMDRHDVSEAITAEIVAQLHQEDLKIQEQFGCRALTYWFDDKRKTAFCLIEAPHKQAIVDMHDRAHGQVPHQVIEVEASVVESFLGRIEDPENTHSTVLNIISEPAFRVLMVVSLNPPLLKPKGGVRSGSSQDQFGNAILNILEIYTGALVKRSENSFYVSFRRVPEAINAALDIKSFFREARCEVDGTGVKIGLSAGVPVTKRTSIFEDTIRLAERMCRVVRGEIIVSSEVTDLFERDTTTDRKGIDKVCNLTPGEEDFINLLMDYTEAHWRDTNLKADSFSRAMGCSKSQLYRKMILLTGKSPQAFLNKFRLEEALQLLKKGKGNVSEVAFETGFSDPSYFSKCFHKTFGQLPSSYLSARAGKAVTDSR